jgi:hypothetical protein
MLAEGNTGAVVPALHFARQALRMAEQVTLYANGNEKLASELTSALKAASAPMQVDSRKIAKRVIALDHAQINLQFEDVAGTTEAFLAHEPKTKLRGNLAQQLGLEMTPMNTIKLNPPFN